MTPGREVGRVKTMATTCTHGFKKGSAVGTVGQVLLSRIGIVGRLDVEVCERNCTILMALEVFKIAKRRGQLW